MDAAGVEQAALLGWGTGGPPLALFFAAAHPDRVLAVCTDSWILDRRASGYPWGLDDDEHERTLARLVEAWGEIEQMHDFVGWAFGDSPGDSPSDDPEFFAWCAKFAREAATPAHYAAFDRMWYQTDVRDVLAAVRVPSLVVYKTDASIWGNRDHAAYLAGRIPLAQMAGVSGSAPVIWIEEPEPFVAAIEAFLLTLREHAADLDRVLATVLFTDIVGSTDAASQLGDRAWKDLVERHHTIVRALLARYRGSEVDTSGDGFFASFDGPARAVRCAEGIIGAVEPLGLEIRAGIHTGEVETIDNKLGGIAVNIGARIGATAEPSEVLVSQTVKDLVVGSHIDFEDRGVHQLKGVSGEWHLHRVVSSRELDPRPPLIAT
jgi:class 3 adenylate cyclase